MRIADLLLKKLARALKISGLALVAAIAALTFLGALQRPDLRAPAGALGQTIVVAGTPVRYHQVGHGPDVLLLHGSPGSLEDWSPLFDRLSGRFRVTAFDRPGHGYSGGADLPHTPEDNARLALELIHALGLKDVVLVGHSYGAITGLALAERNPAEIRAFVLVAPRGYRPVHVEVLYHLLAVPGFGGGLAAALGSFVGPGRIESGVRASFGPDVGLIPPGYVALRTKIWNRPTVATTLSRERVTLEPAFAELEPRYAQIRKPVTLVVGESDERNFRDAQRLARDIPHARLVTFPATGHYVQYAHPDELARIVAETAGGQSRE